MTHSFCHGLSLPRASSLTRFKWYAASGFHAADTGERDDGAAVDREAMQDEASLCRDEWMGIFEPIACGEICTRVSVSSGQYMRNVRWRQLRDEHQKRR